MCHMMENNYMSSTVAEEIMTPHVIMLDIGASFREVVDTLMLNRISAVFIDDSPDNKYYIVSHSDIIQYLSKNGFMEPNLADISVKKIMKGPVRMLDVETSVDNIVRFMNLHGYKRVLISKEGKPAGVVSTRDIMKWNGSYFKPAKPQILLFMDNKTNVLIAKHIFGENIQDIVQDELIDMYGAVFKSVMIITNEIIQESGEIRQMIKDKRCILFEPFQGITGILVSDYNSIELRRKLKIATQLFYETHMKKIKYYHERNIGIIEPLEINKAVSIFT